MSKRKAYPIEILLKMKQLKPDIKFEGADKRKWEDFIENEAESSLFNELENMKSKPEKQEVVEKPKKSKRMKVKQVIESTNTESFDIKVEDEKAEINDNQSETEIQRHQEDEEIPELEA